MSKSRMVLWAMLVSFLVTVQGAQALTCNLDGAGSSTESTEDDVRALADIVVSGQDGICAGGLCDFDGSGGSPNVGDVWKLLAIAQGQFSGAQCGPTLSSIAVSPTSANLYIGQTQQLTATCTFSNQSTQDCTSTVSWTPVSNVSISATGLATGVQESSPSPNVTATSGSITSNILVFNVSSARNPVEMARENTRTASDVASIYGEVLGLYSTAASTANTSRAAAALPLTGQDRTVTVNNTQQGGCQYTGSIVFHGDSPGNHTVSGSVTVSTPTGNECQMGSGTITYQGTMTTTGGLTSPAISMSVVFTSGDFVVTGLFNGALTLATNQFVMTSQGRFTVTLAGTPPGDTSPFSGPFTLNGASGAYFYASGQGEALGTLTIADGSAHSSTNSGTLTFRNPSSLSGTAVTANQQTTIAYAGTVNFEISATSSTPALTGTYTVSSDGNSSGTLKFASTGATLATFTIVGTSLTINYANGATQTLTISNN